MKFMDAPVGTTLPLDQADGIQRRRAFNVYSIYRLILASILLISYF